MSRVTRSNRIGSNRIEDASDKTNMAAKPDLTLQDVIDQLKASVTTLETKLETKIDENAAKISADLKNSENKLDVIDKNTSDLSTRVETLEREVKSKDTRIEQLATRVNELEMEKRKHFVIIEGLQEDKNDNLRRKLDELFMEMELPYDNEWVDIAYRMGKRNDKSKRPRAVKLSFPFLRYRNELFKKSYKLRDSQKFSRVYLVDDYPQETLEEIKELRAVSAFARSKGINSRVRGDKIIVDEKVYSHKEMKNLPYELSIVNAKVIEVEDGTAFQGRHAFLSNHHPCKITWEGKDYHCSEQMFQYTRAVENDEGGVARRIYEATDLKTVITLSKLIKDSPAWKAKEVPTMAAINKRKYDQNPGLKDKLCRTKGHLYEATTHPIYGCGFTLAQSKNIRKNAITAGNKLGEKLEELRDSYFVDG